MELQILNNVRAVVQFTAADAVGGAASPPNATAAATNSAIADLLTLVINDVLFTVLRVLISIVFLPFGLCSPF